MEQIADELDFKDKYISCVECEETFVWQAGEQFFYHTKGLHEPRRCPSCRATRKRTIARNMEGNNGRNGSN